MKAFYGMLVIFILCSTCYISVDSQIDTNVKCSGSSKCVKICIDRYNTRGAKCINGRCTCYP
uniref:Potassium channel toxin alpha-KTx 15.6 n=1 Tax=Tityus discrepans TaxID=57059 RepID=KA156_TITDI|nr:RecName: Full=Potassium channel toxin alpha-KTx 15.6; AltName: Full=Discrepin; Flags: Precursor [Tityus discrepans]CAY61912.1 discrepin precursor [Tityus discrepans]